MLAARGMFSEPGLGPANECKRYLANDEACFFVTTEFNSWEDCLSISEKLETAISIEMLLGQLRSVTGFPMPLFKIICEYSNALIFDQGLLEAKWIQASVEQKISAALLQDRTILKCDILTRQIINLLDSPLGKIFYRSDPFLNTYANNCRKAYMASLLLDAWQSVQPELKIESPSSENQLFELIHTSSLCSNQFQQSLSRTRWRERLNTQANKLFELFTTSVSGVRDQLPLIHYFWAIAWLGDSRLTAQQSIPADIAIDFYSELLKNHEPVKQRFGGFLSRDELESRNESKEIMIRFCSPGINFNSNGKLFFCHRNLVLTDFKFEEASHTMIYRYDPDLKLIKESDELQPRKQPRNVSRLTYSALLNQREFLATFDANHRNQVTQGLLGIGGAGLPQVPSFIAAMALQHQIRALDNVMNPDLYLGPPKIAIRV